MLLRSVSTQGAHIDKVILAQQKGVLLAKLFQLCSGAVKDGTNYYAVDNSGRVDTICEVIGESAKKTVIFGVYRGANHALKVALLKRGITCELVDGDTTATQRCDILRRFQLEEKPRVLVSHPQVVAYGTELAVSDNMIINGPLRTGVFQLNQMLRRMSSAKQTSSSVFITEIVSCVEELQAYAQDDDNVENARSNDRLFNTLAEESKG
jgi:hypothetical protein